MKPLIASALLAGLLAACGEVGTAEVEDAWVRLPAVPGRPGVAYFHLRTAADPVTILKVETPAAARAELHESMTGAGGMMSMTPLKQVAVPAASSVTFEPGGKHVMLFDVNPALKAGSKVPLTLRTAGGATWKVDALVVAPGDPAPPSEGRP